MRRSKINLTPTLCTRAKAGDAKQVLWDGHTLGLALVITPKVETGGGRKTWFFVPRRDGKQIWIRLGEYQAGREDMDDGSTWTLDAARAEASRLRKIHDDGRDVRAVVKEQRTPHTLGESAGNYFESTTFRELSETSKGNERRNWTNHIKPALGLHLIRDLGPKEAQGLFATVEAKGGAKPITPTANHCNTLLGKLIRHAVAIGWREDGICPTSRVKFIEGKPGEHVFTAAEYAATFSAMQALSESGELAQADADAILIMAFSGMRIGEMLKIQWPNVDLAAGHLTLTDHKTVKKIGPRMIPVNGPMSEVLGARRAAAKTLWTVSPWVFPGRKAGAHRHKVTVEATWRVIREKAGLPELVVVHDFRRSVQTHGMELGYTQGVMDELLGHKLPGQGSTYVHLTVAGILAEASEKVARWVEAAMAGQSPQVGKPPMPPVKGLSQA